MGTLISILGIVVLLGIAFLLSNNRKAINFRTVLGALAIQIGIGALILYVPAGRDALDWLAGEFKKSLTMVTKVSASYSVVLLAIKCLKSSAVAVSSSQCVFYQLSFSSLP